MSAFYDIRGLMKMAVEFNDRAGNLSGYLAPLQYVGDDQIDVEVTIHTSAAQVPNLPGGYQRGRYKGLSWQMSWDPTAAHPRRVAFHSPGPFNSFLLHRMVIMPIIRQRLLDRGGFSIPASVVRQAGEVTVFFGPAGAGKTRAALLAVEQGQSFVADNEIAFLPGRAPFGIFDEIELRSSTVRNTRFASRLTPNQRARLIGCDLIAMCTNRRISFNLTLTPKEIGLNSDSTAEFTNGRFVLINGQGQQSLLSRDEAVTRIVAYDQWYRSIFGQWLSADPAAELQNLKANAREILNLFKQDS